MNVIKTEKHTVRNGVRTDLMYITTILWLDFSSRKGWLDGDLCMLVKNDYIN